LTWGLDIQGVKIDKILKLKIEEEVGKTDMAGRESANGAVLRFILICHKYCLPV